MRPDPGDAAFAHASEAELARILDFYGVGWEYEPRTFPLMWNLRGDVVESFTPDFFLPELDLYVELTTLRQKLVRKKNRKLRRMRELYPDVRVKLLYGKDFRALLLKFGRIGLADALSGSVGQTTPPRDAARGTSPIGGGAGAREAAKPSTGAPAHRPTDARHGRRPSPDRARDTADGPADGLAGGDAAAPPVTRRPSRPRHGARRPATRRTDGPTGEQPRGTPAPTDAAGSGTPRRPRTAG